MCIGIAWIRENGHLNHVNGDTKSLLGWTVDEFKDCPMQDVMTSGSYEKMKEIYFKGPPDTVDYRVLTVDMRHKDGHLIPVRLSIVCRWDGRGVLDEAWGFARHCPHQRKQNGLLEWWETAPEEDLGALIHTAEMYVAL